MENNRSCSEIHVVREQGADPRAHRKIWRSTIITSLDLRNRPYNDGRMRPLPRLCGFGLFSEI